MRRHRNFLALRFKPLKPWEILLAKFMSDVRLTFDPFQTKSIWHQMCHSHCQHITNSSEYTYRLFSHLVTRRIKNSCANIKEASLCRHSAGDEFVHLLRTTSTPQRHAIFAPRHTGFIWSADCVQYVYTLSLSLSLLNKKSVGRRAEK
jgi:hypothetical protein